VVSVQATLSRQFRKAEGGDRAARIRVRETTDLARRRGVIAPHRIHLTNYPIGSPVTLFNPALAFRRGCPDCFPLYARIVMGYYKYVSAIARIDLNLDEIMDGLISASHYSGVLVVTPSTRYDIWGAEDPRVSIIGDEHYMTYVGRTVNYFNPRVRSERTLPVTAVSSKQDEWRKKYVFLLPDGLRPYMVSNKDAFLAEAPDGRIVVFHRPHFRLDHGDLFVLAVSKLTRKDLRTAKLGGDSIREVVLEESWSVLEPASFEERVGWAAPPIELGPGKYLLLVHGVDKETQIYRVFAAILDYRGDEPRIEAVTPRYIMEPQTNYERYGDRPYVVFPCGALRVNDEILVSYGASDHFAALATISMDNLLDELDKGRLD
jgi:predicted GH43/DUF377 family glycosyl hydrolase